MQLRRVRNQGYAGVGGGRLAEVLFGMREAGTLSVSRLEIEALQRLAEAESGGQIHAINTYDSAFVSFGFKQWTLLWGELQTLIDLAPAAFARHGIELAGRYTLAGGRTIRGVAGADEPKALRRKAWATRFAAAGIDPEIIAAMVAKARADLERLQRRMSQLGAGEDLRWGDARVRALLLEAYNNRPVVVKAIAPQAGAWLAAHPGAYTVDFREALAGMIREAYAARGELAKAERWIPKVMGPVELPFPESGVIDALRSLRACIDRLEAGDGFEATAWTSRLWPPGHTLRVRFLDGPASLRALVERIARRWTEHANLRFDFGAHPSAEIRISFSGGGHWSLVGTDALRAGPGAATMNFGGWLDAPPDEAEARRVVLHEFGHAIGLVHEHQSPGAGIPWDTEAVYALYGGAPNYWSPAKVNHNVFGRYAEDQVIRTRWDPTSIMQYPVPAALTRGLLDIPWNTDLSPSDAALVAEVYPRDPRSTDVSQTDGPQDFEQAILDDFAEHDGLDPADELAIEAPAAGGFLALIAQARDLDLISAERAASLAEFGIFQRLQGAAEPGRLEDILPGDPDAGWLVTRSDRELTSHRYHRGRGRSMVDPVELVVIHWTATPYKANSPHAGSDIRRQRRWLAGRPDRKSSTHFDILRDGTVLQAAPLSDRTWHAGGSTWDHDGRKRVNARSIGLDLDNVGPLYKVGERFVNAYEWQARRHSPRNFYAGPTPYRDPKGRYWEPYTRAQIESLLRILAKLADALPALLDEGWRLVGHQHVRSTKLDPGPCLPWELARRAVASDFDVEEIAHIDWSAVPGVV